MDVRLRLLEPLSIGATAPDVRLHVRVAVRMPR